MAKVVSMLVAAALLMPLQAARSADLSAVAADVRKGTVEVGTQYSTAFDEGRFHKIHTTVLGLNCETCHAGTEYQADFITMRKYEADAGASPGRLDRGACLGCHKTGGTATTWYSGRATK